MKITELQLLLAKYHKVFGDMDFVVEVNGIICAEFKELIVKQTADGTNFAWLTLPPINTDIEELIKENKRLKAQIERATEALRTVKEELQDVRNQPKVFVLGSKS
jgi:hypothetical protein